VSVHCLTSLDWLDPGTNNFDVGNLLRFIKKLSGSMDKKISVNITVLRSLGK